MLEQRIGRIHRIGQQRGVEVINLISAGTIEEDMLSRLRFKAALFEGVLDGGEDAVFLSNDKFEGLLSGLHDYMENDTPVSLQGISLADEEAHSDAAAVQTEFVFEDGGQSATASVDTAEQPATTLLQRLTEDLAELLKADEQTRQEVLRQLEKLFQTMRNNNNQNT